MHYSTPELTYADKRVLQNIKINSRAKQKNILYLQDITSTYKFYDLREHNILCTTEKQKPVATKLARVEPVE